MSLHKFLMNSSDIIYWLYIQCFQIRIHRNLKTTNAAIKGIPMNMNILLIKMSKLRKLEYRIAFHAEKARWLHIYCPPHVFVNAISSLFSETFAILNSHIQRVHSDPVLCVLKKLKPSPKSKHLKKWFDTVWLHVST